MVDAHRRLRRQLSLLLGFRRLRRQRAVLITVFIDPGLRRRLAVLSPHGDLVDPQHVVSDGPPDVHRLRDAGDGLDPPRGDGARDHRLRPRREHTVDEAVPGIPDHLPVGTAGEGREHHKNTEDQRHAGDHIPAPGVLFRHLPAHLRRVPHGGHGPLLRKRLVVAQVQQGADAVLHVLLQLRPDGLPLPPGQAAEVGEHLGAVLRAIHHAIPRAEERSTASTAPLYCRQLSASVRRASPPLRVRW